MSINSITRLESILAGKDVEPVTRLEYLLKVNNKESHYYSLETFDVYLEQQDMTMVFRLGCDYDELLSRVTDFYDNCPLGEKYHVIIRAHTGENEATLIPATLTIVYNHIRVLTDITMLSLTVVGDSELHFIGKNDDGTTTFPARFYDMDVTGNITPYNHLNHRIYSLGKICDLNKIF